MITRTENYLEVTIMKTEVVTSAGTDIPLTRQCREILAAELKEKFYDQKLVSRHV